MKPASKSAERASKVYAVPIQKMRAGTEDVVQRRYNNALLSS